MTDTGSTPTPAAGKINLATTIKNDALATETWFAKHPRAIFALIGLIVGLLIGHFV